MRTAITLHKKKEGWALAAGPEVRADKQWHDFKNIGGNWPKDVDEVRFQFGDGKTRSVLKDKARNIAAQIANAEKHRDEKIANAKKNDEKAKAEQAQIVAAKLKADSEANAMAIKAKEEAKKAPK